MNMGPLNVDCFLPDPVRNTAVRTVCFNLRVCVLANVGGGGGATCIVSGIWVGVLWSQAGFVCMANVWRDCQTFEKDCSISFSSSRAVSGSQAYLSEYFLLST